MEVKKIKFLYSFVHVCVRLSFSHFVFNIAYFYSLIVKMVDNKSKTSLVRHIQKKYVTHED